MAKSVAIHQFNYACMRIDKLAEEAVLKAGEMYLIKKERKLTVEEMKELVANENVPFRSCSISKYNLREVFDFSRYENENMYDEAKLKRFRDSVYSRATALKDNLALGTAQDALRVIEEFDKELQRKLRSVKGNRPVKIS